MVDPRGCRRQSKNLTAPERDVTIGAEATAWQRNKKPQQPKTKWQRHSVKMSNAARNRKTYNQTYQTRQNKKNREHREANPDVCGTCYRRVSLALYKSCGPCLERHRRRNVAIKKKKEKEAAELSILRFQCGDCGHPRFLDACVVCDFNKPFY